MRSSVADEVEQRQVMSVPSVFLDDKPFDQGRMSVEQILARIDKSAAGRQAARIQGKAPFDVLVVGAGPAGASAAIYASRKGVAAGMVAERIGGQVLDTLAIENLISTPYTEGPRLAAQLEEHVREYEVDIMQLQKARAITPAGEDGLIGIELESGANLQARTVVLATGARWRQLGVPGEDTYRNRGVAYCPHCDGPLFKGKHVSVIGGVSSSSTGVRPFKDDARAISSAGRGGTRRLWRESRSCPIRSCSSSAPRSCTRPSVTASSRGSPRQLRRRCSLDRLGRAGRAGAGRRGAA